MSIINRQSSITLAVAFALVTAGCATEATRPPNVIVVLVDDLRWDDIGIAGHPFAQTPAIDRLAREGSNFLNAFATTPVRSPIRAAIAHRLSDHHDCSAVEGVEPPSPDNHDVAGSACAQRGDRHHLSGYETA